jgi:hypothetical protein
LLALANAISDGSIINSRRVSALKLAKKKKGETLAVL